MRKSRVSRLREKRREENRQKVVCLPIPGGARIASRVRSLVLDIAEKHDPWGMRISYGQVDNHHNLLIENTKPAFREALVSYFKQYPCLEDQYGILWKVVLLGCIRQPHLSIQIMVWGRRMFCRPCGSAQNHTWGLLDGHRLIGICQKCKSEVPFAPLSLHDPLNKEMFERHLKKVTSLARG